MTIMRIRELIAQKFQVWWVLIAYSTVQSGFLAILFAYFVKNHLDFSLVLLAEALGYGLSVLFIISKRQFNTRHGMWFGLGLVLCSLPLLLSPLAPFYILIPYTLLKTSGGIMFYIPYNTLFFAKTNQEKKLHRMTMYWAIGSTVGILAPMTGGLLFASFGLPVFVGIALTILVVGICLAGLVKPETHPYTLHSTLTNIKGFRLVSMFDGSLYTGSNLLITLYLLTFIKGEFNFGTLLSIIALVSVALTFRIARWSDRIKKRWEFIWPLSFGVGLIMASLFFVHSLVWAVVLIVAYQVLISLFNPLRSNILFDNVEHTPATWVSREFYLDVGRAIVLLCLAFVVYTGHLREAFLIMAALFAFFPFLLLLKGVYRNH